MVQFQSGRRAAVAAGHGQMPERALERTMMGFLQGKADVLVCTTIIESGLDIPTVNTIFVDDAHMFGLADLHQLRGRVGRYLHQAHAIFMIGKDRSVSEIAIKRLKAIEEFSDLGSGFQIAMRDMEIRGVGNILGAEQSGHIASVGYDLYCRLLDAAVKQKSKHSFLQPREVEINLDFTAFIPEGYIPERRQRIGVYRKLGRCRDEAAFAQVVAELRDRFGPPPEEVAEFVLLARIRATLEAHFIHRLEGIPEGLILTADRLQRLVKRLDIDPDGARLLGKNRVLLVHERPFSGPRDVLELLERVLGPRAEERLQS